MNKNCLSYWFPLIRDAGLPVPKTEIVTIPDYEHKSFAIWALDGGGPAPISPFFRSLVQAAERLGFPCFLRTGQGSGKHEWDRCCNLRAVGDISSHVAALIDWSESVDMLGLPWNVWAVREMLPVEPFGVCPRYGNMPVVREHRVFVDGGRVLWSQPYWPLEALEQGGFEADVKDGWYEKLCEMDPRVLDLAQAAGKALGGKWSVDILATKRGWMITDLAEAERSYGWDEKRYEALQ